MSLIPLPDPHVTAAGIAEKAAGQAIALPFHPHFTETQAAFSVGHLERRLRQCPSGNCDPPLTRETRALANS